MLAVRGRDLNRAEALVKSAIELDRQRQLESKPDLIPEEIADNPLYLDSLGYVLFKQGRLVEAKDLVLQCLETTEGQLLEVYDHLGDIHWALGEEERAIAAWKKAIEVGKDTPLETRLEAEIVEKLKSHSALP
jgi:tetratricopeptide (TPR) repeat protein